jgi:hypothetical protein
MKRFRLALLAAVLFVGACDSLPTDPTGRANSRPSAPSFSDMTMGSGN